ncbi:Low affinity immunoglobulin gamma Fc region receptor II-b [Camelus dromedarius]|nr:Low affinity immunoglobulin gamma Fc region receptor II-b [Camelus dromedarius]
MWAKGPNNPGDDFTQWFHIGSSIPTQLQLSYSFKASSKDSGDYKCQTGQTSLSDPVHLDVISGSSLSSSSLVMIVVAVVAGIAAVAIVATVVARLRLRRKQISANLNDAEEAAKAEAENTVTYSLLLHPEVAEEETEPDYQNHL